MKRKSERKNACLRRPTGFWGRNRTFIFVLFLGVAAGLRTGDGQEAEEPGGGALMRSGPHAIDLVTVLRLAGADNLEIAFFRERIEEARANEKEAGYWYLPDLTVGASYYKHEGRIQSTEGDILDVTKGSQFTGGSVEFAIDLLDGIYEHLAARQLRDASQAAYQGAVQETLARAAFQYYDLVEAAEQVRIAEDAMESSTELLRISQRLADSGAGLEADVLRARGQLARDDQDRLKAQTRSLLVAAKLTVTLRLDPTVRLAPVREPSRPIRLIDEQGPLTDFLAGALAERPDLAEARALREASLSREKAARWGPWVPEIGASGEAGYFGGGTGGTLDDFGGRSDYVVFLRWRLEGMGLGSGQRQRAAESRRRQSDVRVLQLEQEVRAQVVAQRDMLQSLRRQIEIAATVLTSAQEAVRLSQSRYEQGAGIFLEVLDAQQELVRARGDHLSVMIEYNQAQHDLLRLLGRRPAAVSGEPVAGNTAPLGSP